MRGRSCGVTLVEGGTSINTHGLARVSKTVFEGTSIVVSGHVPSATHNVVNMLAQARALWSFFTSSDAELSGRHEVRPFMQLLQLATVEHVGEDQATDGIAISGGTMRIELTTGITGGDIHGGEITNTRYLDVIGGLNEVSSLNCSRGNEACSVSGLGTPRNDDLLNVSYSRVGTRFGWRPDAKVLNGIYVHILTSGVLAARRAAFVGAGLPVFCLVGQVGWIIGSTVCLGVDTQDKGERDQSNKAKTRGIHGGRGQGRRSTEIGRAHV